MKKFFIKLFVTLGIILAVVGGNYHLYKIGWWEKTLSTTVIPFQWFRTDENKSVSKYSVKNDGNRSSDTLKKELSGVTDAFNNSEGKRPDVSQMPLTEKSKNKLDKLLDPIYGVENQFVGESHVTGLVQDKDGWNPIITFSVFNDTSTIRNISYKAVKNSDNLWSLSEKISDTNDDFAYIELPSDFQTVYLDQIITQDNKFYNNKQWKIATGNTPAEVTDLLSKNYPNVTSRVVYFESTTSVKIYRAFGTPTGIEYVVRTQGLDNANSTIYTLAVEK